MRFPGDGSRSPRTTSSAAAITPTLCAAHSSPTATRCTRCRGARLGSARSSGCSDPRGGGRQFCYLPPMLKDAVPLGEIAHALIVVLRHHGDVLLASPVATALKARAPRVEIDALVYDDTAQMLEGHPALAA